MKHNLQSNYSLLVILGDLESWWQFINFLIPSLFHPFIFLFRFLVRAHT